MLTWEVMYISTIMAVPTDPRRLLEEIGKRQPARIENRSEINFRREKKGSLRAILPGGQGSQPRGRRHRPGCEGSV